MHSFHNKNIAKPTHVPSDTVGSSLNLSLLRLEKKPPISIINNNKANDEEMYEDNRSTSHL
jgi:hypothetical protein